MVARSWAEVPTPSPSFEELSVLSLDAAIDLDRLQRGEAVDPGAIQNLATNLGFRANSAWSDDILKSHTDPRTVDLYSRAVMHLTNARISTVTELATKIRQVADAFTRDIGIADPADLRKMRDFCLALHSELLAETYDRHAESVEHP